VREIEEESMKLDSGLKEILELIQKQYLYIFCCLHEVGAEKVYSFAQFVKGYELYTAMEH